MLGKLIKYDFKATGKVLLPLNLLLVGITLVGSILLRSRMLQRPELFPVAIILLIAYVLAIIALGTITLIYLAVYFYRNLFSAQGYLTFTLPATPWSLLHAKVIVGSFWSLLNSILAFGSAAILLVSSAGLDHTVKTLLSFETTYNVNGKTSAFTTSLPDLLGYSLGEIALLLVVFTASTCIASILMCYASITLGQLYTKHKIGASVGIYVGFYFLLQILTGMVMLILCLRPAVDFIVKEDIAFSPASLEQLSQAIYKPMFPSLIIIYAVIGIISYIVTGLIINKKVNLD